MVRRRFLLVSLAFVSLIVVYFAVSLYTMNASYSVPDAEHEAYYQHYARIWGITAILAGVGFLACVVGAWRAGRERPHR